MSDTKEINKLFEAIKKKCNDEHYDEVRRAAKVLTDIFGEGVRVSINGNSETLPTALYLITKQASKATEDIRVAKEVSKVVGNMRTLENLLKINDEVMK